MLKFRTALCTGLLACSGSAPAPSAAPHPVPSPSASAPAPPPTVTVDREVVAPGQLEALPIRIAVARGTDRAFAVFDLPDAEETIVAPLREDGLGEPRRIAGRLAAVAGRGEDVWWVTQVGETLCVEGSEGRACHEVRAKAAVALPRGLALVDARRHIVEEGRGPSKERVGAAPVEREPVEMDVVVQRVDAAGQLVGEALESGLRFNRPLEGMAVVDATASADGIALLYFEEAKPRRDGRQKIPQARLRLARLDGEGAFVEGSAKVLYEGDRKFGYIDGHHRPRVFGDGEHTVAVARFVERKKGGNITAGWEAWNTGGRSLSAPSAWCGLRPLALVAPPDDEDEARLAALWKHAPRLVDGQPGSDAGRVAWVGSRGWFLLDGALHFVDRDHPEPTPHTGLRVRRATLRWTDGVRAITHAGLHLPDGLRESPVARDVLDSTAIGDAPWWVVRSGERMGATLVGLDGAGPPVPVGDFALAGALRLVRDGPRLTVTRWQGERVEVLATVATPIHGWLAAVSAGDGALLVGEATPGGELLSVVLTATGSLSEPRALGVKAPAPAHRMLEARPGGAVVAAAETWLWLDAAGRPTGVAKRAAPIPCDGGYRPPAVPAGPSTLLPWPEDLCLPHPPTALADGRVAAHALQIDGPHQDVVRVVLGTAQAPTPAPAPKVAARPAPPPRGCPADMVDVGSYCIDRFESHLTDEEGQLLSPHYPPTAGILGTIFKAWAFGRLYEGDLAAHALPLPPLLRPQDAATSFVARNALGAAPSGYLTGYAAKKACRAAGKRLCSHDEWVRACKGERQTQFPYGDDYVQGRCNVFRFTHPARVLHDNPSIGHLDPRLNLVADGEGPLRERSGTRGGCASPWGDDAVYDMVGNLDEWFGGRGDSGFAGGFYARSTRKGCEAAITVHPRRYMDYSLGVRCCASTTSPREE